MVHTECGARTARVGRRQERAFTFCTSSRGVGGREQTCASATEEGRLGRCEGIRGVMFYCCSRYRSLSCLVPVAKQETYLSL